MRCLASISEYQIAIPLSKKEFYPLMSITTLARTIENVFDKKDCYRTLNGRILRDHLSVKEEKMRGGPLTACRESYEVKGQSLQREHMYFEHYSWDRDNGRIYTRGRLRRPDAVNVWP